MVANILVVGDSPTYIKLMQSILESVGHTVTTCLDGRETLTILSKASYDVILLDVILKNISGFEILKDLQDHEDYKDIPVILLTGLGDPDYVKRGLDMGALDCIKKPCEKTEIIARVNAARRVKEKHDLLLEYAITDVLTQVRNRAYIDRKLKNLTANKHEYPKGIGFIMADCDFFKNINDTYGHQAGDIVLKGVAQAISRTVKNIDTVGRFGGEEFCIILPNTHLDETILAADRIRKNVERTYFNFDDNDVNITISLGVTHTVSDDQLTPSDLIALADVALYQAKDNGRNRVEVSKTN